MLTRTRSLLRRHFVLVVIVSLFVLTATTAAAVQKLGGTSMPGAHNFVQNIGDQAMCADCHGDIAAELEAGPHVAPALSDCTFCHNPWGAAHSSSPAKCTDCHSVEAGEMFAANEAHMGMADQIGETAVDMSLTCMACHTEIDVKIKSKVQHPLEFTIGTDA